MQDDETLARIEAHMRRGNELLARIDEHLERGIADTSPEHLARGTEFEARLEQHMLRSNEVIAANGTSYDEWRYALRQDSLRNERILGEMSQSLARHTDELTGHANQLTLHTNELTRRTDAIIAEGRAHRAALWAVLDQMRGDDGPAPATG